MRNETNKYSKNNKHTQKNRLEHFYFLFSFGFLLFIQIVQCCFFSLPDRPAPARQQAVWASRSELCLCRCWIVGALWLRLPPSLPPSWMVFILPCMCFFGEGFICLFVYLRCTSFISTRYALYRFYFYPISDVPFLYLTCALQVVFVPDMRLPS